MEVPDNDSPSLPREPSPPSDVARAGCFLALGLSLLAMLYVGSYVVLALEWRFGPGYAEALDEATGYALGTFYWPLIRIDEAIFYR